MTGRFHLPRSLIFAALALLALAAVACGGSDTAPGVTTSPTPGASSDGSAAGGPDAAAFPYATGPAVLVPAGYEPPGDRVDSTGAFIPANGRPTLVFVDAIW
jgi:hypothetical protein